MLVTLYLPLEIIIGFSQSSLSSDEASGNVTLSVRVLNGEIRDGHNISVRVFTADNSAQGNQA